MHHATFAAGLLAALLAATPATAQSAAGSIARSHCRRLAAGHDWNRAIRGALSDAFRGGITPDDIPPGDVVGAIQAWCPALNREAFMQQQEGQ